MLQPHQDVEQRRGHDRLGQHHVEPEVGGVLEQLLAAEPGDHDRRRAGRRCPAAGAACARASGAPSPGRPCRACASPAARRRRGGPRRGCASSSCSPSSPVPTTSACTPQASNMSAEDQARGLLVVDDERAQAAHPVQVELEVLGARRLPMRTVKLKVLPAPGALSTPISPPISCDQLLADRQAQAGAAVLARRRVVGLRERLEQLAGLLVGQADAGVAAPRSAAACRSARARRLRPSASISPRSVNLTALPTRLFSTCVSRIGSPTSSVGTSGAISNEQLQALVLDLRAEQVGDVVQRLLERELDLLECPAGRPRSSRSRGCR